MCIPTFIPTDVRRPFGILNADVMWSNNKQYRSRSRMTTFGGLFRIFLLFFFFAPCHLLVSGPVVLWSLQPGPPGHNQEKQDKHAGFCTGRRRAPHELVFLHEFLNGLLWICLCWSLCLCWFVVCLLSCLCCLCCCIVAVVAASWLLSSSWLLS